jgi:putative transposon-encoded protein
MTEPMNVSTQAFQAIEKTVKQMGNSGGIYLPKEWVGKRVRILLMDQL